MKPKQRIITSLFVGMLLCQQVLATPLEDYYYQPVISPLDGVKQSNGNIVYTGRMAPPKAGNGWCNFGGDRWILLKYSSIYSDYNPFYTLKFEAKGNLDSNFLTIQGNNSGTPRVKVSEKGYIDLRLILQPIPDPNGGVFQDNVIPAGAQIINGDLTYACAFNTNTTVTPITPPAKMKLTTANLVKIDETCELMLAADRSVKLEDTFLQEVKNNDQVYGGTFPIQLNCRNATVNSVYISYTDGVNPTTTGQILTTDTSIDSAAQNVGLKIYDQTNSTVAISYAPAPATQFITPTSTISTFEANIRNNRNPTKTYKVYYVKSGGTPTAGSVTGRLKYNLYYR